MSTIRVYELAKEVNKTNKEVLDFLKSKNIELTLSLIHIFPSIGQKPLS